MEICIQSEKTHLDLGAKAGYRMIKEAGFTGIDWNIDRALDRKALKDLSLGYSCIFEKSLDEVLAFYDEELTAIRENGLVISQAHAPFPPFMATRPELLDYSIGIYKRTIELCDAVGCKYLVIHGVCLAENDPVNTPETVKALNEKLYGGLIDTLKKTSVTVCLENLIVASSVGVAEGVCADAHEAIEYIDTLNAKAGKECFGLCLDTGHLHALRKSFPAYISLLGKRIKALHIHDNNGHNDQHLMPYAGTINWEEFCQCLAAIGYEGDLSFETFAQTTKKRIPLELLPDFLRTIAHTGEVFRKKILAK